MFIGCPRSSRDCQRIRSRTNVIRTSVCGIRIHCDHIMFCRNMNGENSDDNDNELKKKKIEK